MNGPFPARLRNLTSLNDDDVAALAALFSGSTRTRAEQQVIDRGDRPRRLHVVAEGWMARVKTLRDGRRHLATLLVPGDVCDIDGLHLRCYDYGVVALTAGTLAWVELDEVLALCAARPAIARALTWLGCVDNALLNEAVTSLALRSAPQRVAHLLCELRERLAMVGLADDGTLALPLSQAQLSDALGMTAVHLNRVLRELREGGLVTVAGRHVVVPDWTRLRQVALFSPDYLQREGRHALAA